MKEPIPFRELIGKKPEKIIVGNFEGSHATYALYQGIWYSINGGVSAIVDVRWHVSSVGALHELLNSK